MEQIAKSSRRKADLYKKKDAFYLYKLVGIERASVFYPEYRNFILCNKEKEFSEIEKEIDRQIAFVDFQPEVLFGRI